MILSTATEISSSISRSSLRHSRKLTMSSSDGFVPIIINLAGQTRINEVVLVDENIESFEVLAASFYQSLRPTIPEFYLEQGERTITKMWVDWNQSGGNFLPMETEINNGNLRAVLRLLAVRRGVDMIRVWLNEID